MYIVNNAIMNCHVTVSDTKRAVIIYELDVATLKLRSTKEKPSIVPIIEPIMLHVYILRHHRNVDLTTDF